MRDGPLAPALTRAARFDDGQTQRLGDLLRELSVKADLAGSVTLSAEQMRQIVDSYGINRK